MMDKEFINKLIVKYPGRRQANLLDMLVDIQEELGYLSGEAIGFVSSYFNIPESRIFSIASFYPNFRYKKPGKYHIKICRGTNCHIKHSSRLLDTAMRELKIQTGQTTNDGLFTLDVISCVGSCSCGKSPAVLVNGELIDDITDLTLINLINTYKSKNKHDAA